LTDCAHHLTWILIYLQIGTLGFIAFHLTETAYTRRKIMSALQETVDQITAELARAYGEIKAEIAQVQAQLDAASVPAEQVDLSALQAAADMLDGIVPDEPTKPEGEELELTNRDDPEDK